MLPHPRGCWCKEERDAERFWGLFWPFLPSLFKERREKSRAEAAGCGQEAIPSLPPPSVCGGDGEGSGERRIVRKG